MRTDLSFFGAARNRVLVIIGVIALSLWMLYPIQDSLKLGIDLNGGVQLVLRVKTDDALLLQTQAAAERMRTTSDRGTCCVFLGRRRQCDGVSRRRYRR